MINSGIPRTQGHRVTIAAQMGAGIHSDSFCLQTSAHTHSPGGQMSLQTNSEAPDFKAQTTIGEISFHDYREFELARQGRRSNGVCCVSRRQPNCD